MTTNLITSTKIAVQRVGIAKDGTVAFLVALADEIFRSGDSKPSTAATLRRAGESIDRRVARIEVLKSNLRR